MAHVREYTGTAGTAGSGASFRLEADLCAVLASGALAALGAAAATMLGEIQVGLVIPDLVFVSGAIAPTWDLELSGFESWIVADLLRARARRPETLAARLFSRPERTTLALKTLERKGLVSRTGATVALRYESFPRASEVVAVEAKLTRWREAVDQATVYRRFANRSYVALPWETIRAAKGLRSACRGRGLGLVAVSPDRVDVVRTAPVHHPRTPEWVWLVGRALALGDATVRPPRARSSTRAGVPAPSARGTLPRRTP